MARISSQPSRPTKPQRTASRTSMRAADARARAERDGEEAGEVGEAPGLPDTEGSAALDDERRPPFSRPQRAQKPPAAARQGGQMDRLPPARHDGFESAPKAAGPRAAPALHAPMLAGAPIAPTPPMRVNGGAMYALHHAKEPGVYFREEGHEGGRPEEVEDPELAAAVEECIRLLFGVRGIHRIGAGTNDAGEQVIVVNVSRGFSQSALSAIPERVHRFKTLVALPYDLLPLRRETP